jgi:uncharacterized protein YjiS (DUF1127 family)
LLFRAIFPGPGEFSTAAQTVAPTRFGDGPGNGEQTPGTRSDAMTILSGTVAETSIARPAHGPGLLQRALHAAARAIRRQRTQRALGQLSDHALRDIGLRRCEIDSIADSLAEGRWDATRVLRGHFGFWI